MKRFWDKVNKTANCWLWTGAKTRGGYGCFHVCRENGKNVHAVISRYVWELFNGLIPTGLQVLHKCDTPSCCNPDHLWLGTLKENIQDASRKGRLTQGKLGNKNAAKLTGWDVSEIRRRTDMGRGVLARAFLVTRSNIDQILTRKTWRNL